MLAFSNRSVKEALSSLYSKFNFKNPLDRQLLALYKVFEIDQVINSN
jgi:hypothetical protein